MKNSPQTTATMLAIGLVCGCFHTISGPGRAPRRDSAPSSGNLRVVYAGQHVREPAEFTARLATAISTELGRAITLERSTERQLGDALARWPAGIAEARDGEEIIVLRAVEGWKCGTPAFAMMVGSAMTLGLLPVMDEDRIIWATEIRNGTADAARRSQFHVDRRTYAWLPLVPFVPLNVGWRALRGDEHDYFIRTFPSHVSAELTSVESRSAFVEELIEQYGSAPKDASPGSIWSYRYQGREVVYVPPLYCCDLPSRLYDGDGNVLCSPDGGIAGAGDGRCPDFLAERTEGRRVWQDPRSQSE